MKGHHVNELDVKNKNKHAVIGRLANPRPLQARRPHYEEFIDIEKGNSVFKVVGIVQEMMEETMKNFIYISTNRLKNDKMIDIVSHFVWWTCWRFGF